MNYLKRIGLALVLTLSLGIGFSAQVDHVNPINQVDHVNPINQVDHVNPINQVDHVNPINKDAAVLLEEAIYIEETLGDFDEAAGIYRRIADGAESGRAIAAQALYRLGMYYEERGRAAEAKAAFERLAKQYPEQRELILRVPGLADTRRDLPKFLPAPWEDGEMLTYSSLAFTVKSVRLGVPDAVMTGPIVTYGSYSGAGAPDVLVTGQKQIFSSPGDLVYEGISDVITSSSRTFVAESASKNGKKAWRFRSIFGIGGAGTAQYGTVLTDDTLAPVETLHKPLWSTTGHSVRTEYFSNRVAVSRTSYDANSVNEFNLTGTVYDSKQIIYLLRCLPLRTGFETNLPVFNENSITNRRISVEGREVVVTPAGTFNAWKVAYGNKGAETFYWISDDNRRYPVKIAEASTSDNVFLLVSISGTKNSKPAEYTDQEIRFFLPPGWLHTSGLLSGQPASIPAGAYREGMNTFIGFVDPELEMEGYMRIFQVQNPYGEDTQSLLSITADDLVRDNKERFKDYGEIPGSRENITTASGRTGIRFITKRDAGNEIRVLYNFMVTFGDKFIWGFLKVAANDDFDRQLPAFDAIIESIQFK